MRFLPTPSDSRPIATGLDFSGVFALAGAMGVHSVLFVELLPEIEAIIVRAANRRDE